MGELAARIHSIKTTGFGQVFDWSDNKLSKNSTWKKYLNNDLGMTHRLSVLRRHGGLSDTAISRIVATARRLAAWKGTPSLAHGDLRLKNVMVDERDTVVAVIDWEECHSAPALLWDLSIALHDLGMDGKQAFLEGYGIAPKKYAELAPLIKVFNILHYAPVLERIVKRKDRERLQYYRLRLAGALDMFSL
jgi:hygromycin-B 4-O-kinase